jgi:hypothetical protein
MPGMVEHVTVSTPDPERVRPLLQSAIQRELGALDAGIKRTQIQLAEFESRFQMKTPDFRRRFHNRELQESLDFLDWWMEALAFDRLNAQRRALGEARVD